MIRQLAHHVVIVALSVLVAPATFALSTNPMDIDLSDDAPVSGLPISPRMDAADPGPAVPSIAVPRPAAPVSQRTLSANPLWAIPLPQLPVTRERPIFSPSRRPPPTAVAAEPVAEAPRAPPPREPERPDLTLVGTIASDNEGFGIFLDQSTKTPLRLKVGEDYQGWKLRAVWGREATLVRDQQAVIMTLPQPDGTGDGEVHLMPVSAVSQLSSQRP